MSQCAAPSALILACTLRQHPLGLFHGKGNKRYAMCVCHHHVPHLLQHLHVAAASIGPEHITEHRQEKDSMYLWSDM
jgi:hypothetical protein